MKTCSQNKKQKEEEKKEKKRHENFSPKTQILLFLHVSLRKNASLKKKTTNAKKRDEKTSRRESVEERDVFWRRERDGGSSGKEIHRWSDRIVRHAGTNWIMYLFYVLCFYTTTGRRGGSGNRFFASSSCTSSSSVWWFWPLSLLSLSLFLCSALHLC